MKILNLLFDNLTGFEVFLIICIIVLFLAAIAALIQLYINELTKTQELKKTLKTDREKRFSKF